MRCTQRNQPFQLQSIKTFSFSRLCLWDMAWFCCNSFKSLAHLPRGVVGCCTMWCGGWLTVWQDLTASMFRATLEGTGRTSPTGVMALQFEIWSGNFVKWLDMTQIKPVHKCPVSLRLFLEITTEQLRLDCPISSSSGQDSFIVFSKRLATWIEFKLFACFHLKSCSGVKMG